MTRLTQLNEVFGQSTLEVEDGVTLAVFDKKGPREDAPVLFLSNGLGGNIGVWRHLIDFFAPTHRIVSWDYRGLYGSALDKARSREVDVGIDSHVRDAMRVMDDRGIERAVLVGWSMGVQLNFDLVQHLDGERVEAIVALSGGYGRTLRSTAFGKVGEPMVLPIMEAFRVLVDNLGGPLRKVVGRPYVLELAKKLKVVAPSLDEGVFLGLVDDFLQLDFEVYNRIMASLGDHDVEHVLPSLSVPVLVAAGDRDPMTPHWLSKRMVELIPRAELLLMEGGSHYAPAEFPERLNRRIEQFLRERTGHFE